MFQKVQFVLIKFIPDKCIINMKGVIPVYWKVTLPCVLLYQVLMSVQYERMQQLHIQVHVFEWHKFYYWCVTSLYTTQGRKKNDHLSLVMHNTNI